MDVGYNKSYNSAVMTAISIPDSVFDAAELAAERLAISRSQLYTRALQEFLALHGSENVTEQLNRVYAETDSSLDPTLIEVQRRSLADDAR